MTHSQEFQQRQKESMLNSVWPEALIKRLLSNSFFIVNLRGP